MIPHTYLYNSMFTLYTHILGNEPSIVVNTNLVLLRLGLSEVAQNLHNR